MRTPPEKLALLYPTTRFTGSARKSAGITGDKFLSHLFNLITNVFEMPAK